MFKGVLGPPQTAAPTEEENLGENCMVWKVYLLKCNDGSLYCGVAKDVEARVAVHNSGKGAKYTRSRLPVTLVAVSPDFTKREAYQFEYRVKRLPARKKCGVILTGQLMTVE